MATARVLGWFGRRVSLQNDLERLGQLEQQRRVLCYGGGLAAIGALEVANKLQELSDIVSKVTRIDAKL